MGKSKSESTAVRFTRGRNRDAFIADHITEKIAECIFKEKVESTFEGTEFSKSEHLWLIVVMIGFQ
ncbi:hypothetical protein [Peribacillus sp. TH14]|uniref:hypothetical protein n=1 Tax=Peribacillus sp. TH14 TaxID=2798481 RepID=UPI001911B7CC|nr:hypothetical protein [Peribacillus sp. TH14]MBK5500156.1 hypothetical protein [Peribacillus sp. TH14]